jgi:hypothetical protein
VRSEFLKGLLGKPWAANARGPTAYDCFHLFVLVQKVMFGVEVVDVEMPENPSWRWMIDTIESHADRPNWREVPTDPMGLVKAKDGAMVLMARNDHPAHIGVWLAAEKRILHVDQKYGVVLESLSDLRMKGWSRLTFYERS